MEALHTVTGSDRDQHGRYRTTRHRLRFWRREGHGTESGSPGGREEGAGKLKARTLRSGCRPAGREQG